MTEADWQTCTDLIAMLDFLQTRTTERKWRLYLCGGCRQIVHLLYSGMSLNAVDAGERFVDGETDAEELP